ncbi:hypothetical protein JMG10_11395 [Nostoc ellipsosporum NOK]|jgi:septation ring formation regulator EzrA|nr:hypothetical protein [Nostoc ellipsosporum NOK]
MVQVETTQLTEECVNWRNTLRRYRDEFSQEKARLQQATSRPLSRDQLQTLEHLDNQLHIQLINIHDLKQAIKQHAGQVGAEQAHENRLRDERYAQHEQLFEEYQRLDAMLDELREELKNFHQA